MKILVGSLNPAKIEATRMAFSKFFDDIEIVGIQVDSHVPAQPKDDETYFGAENRTAELMAIDKERKLNADFFVGIEGGITKIHSIWFAFGAMCIKDRDGKMGFGTSPHLQLPDVMVKMLLSGKELGDVTDEISALQNTKHGIGAVGFLTNNKMTRKEFYVPGLIVAMAPFVSKKLYEQ